MLMRSSLILLASILIGFTACEPKPAQTIVPHTKGDPIGLPKEVSIDLMKGTCFTATMQEVVPDSDNIVYSPTLLLAWAEVCSYTGLMLDPPAPLAPLQNGIKDASLATALLKEDYTTLVKTTGEAIDVKVSLAKTLVFAADMVKDEDPLYFKDTFVECFGMPYHTSELAKQISILYYESNERFVIALHCKDPLQEIILAMGFNDNKNIASMVDSVQYCINQGKEQSKVEGEDWRYEFDKEDVVRIPSLSFNISKSYTQYLLSNVAFQKDLYDIQKVDQRIACVLNEKGARVESEAEVLITKSISLDKRIKS